MNKKGKNMDSEIEFLPEAEEFKTYKVGEQKRNYKRIAWISIISILLALTLAIYVLYQINLWFNSHTFHFQSPIRTPIWIEARPGHEVIKEAEAVYLPSGSDESNSGSTAINFSGASFIERTGSPENEDQDIQTRPTTSEIVRKIFQLESSSGKNDGCVRDRLGFNGYGYRQNNREWKCFPTREEVAGYVAWQIEKNLKTMDLPTALCFYNTGHKLSDCKYYQDYLVIK